MTLNAMFKYPDIYHTGISIAAVPNMRYYDSIYQERYQGILELLLNELIKQDKQFSMMAYPNRSHSINEGANTSVHLYTMMKNFFMNNLPAGPR